MNKFEVVPQKFDRHVIIPDLHGENNLFTSVVDQYINKEDIGFVLLGDIIDKSGKYEEKNNTSHFLSFSSSQSIKVIKNNIKILTNFCMINK